MNEISKSYEAVLGLSAPGSIEHVETTLDAGEARVTVALPSDTRWVCPECRAEAPIHDHASVMPATLPTPSSSGPPLGRIRQ